MKTVISFVVLLVFFAIFTKQKPAIKLREVPKVERFNVGVDILKKRQEVDLIKSEIRLLHSQVEFKIKN